VVNPYTKSRSSTKSRSIDELSQPSRSGSSWGFVWRSRPRAAGGAFFYGIRGWGGPGGGRRGRGSEEYAEYAESGIQRARGPLGSAQLRGIQQTTNRGAAGLGLFEHAAAHYVALGAHYVALSAHYVALPDIQDNRPSQRAHDHQRRAHAHAMLPSKLKTSRIQTKTKT
jgi:hypothetical protein